MRYTFCFLVASLQLALQAQAAGTQAYVFPGGTLGYYQGVMAPTKSGGTHYISQISEPDHVCQWLGWEKAIAWAESEWICKDPIVIGPKGPIGAERSPVYHSITCGSSKAAAPALKPDYRKKRRLDSGDILISDILSAEPPFRGGTDPVFATYEPKSDLNRICEIFGYKGGAVDHTLNKQSNGRMTLLNVRLEKDGTYSSFERKYWEYKDTLPNGTYIQSITCKK